jgi:hypothetical protein
VVPGDALSWHGPNGRIFFQATPMRLKSKCCFKFESKAKACKKCPIMAAYTKKKRKKKLAKINKKISQAA